MRSMMLGLALCACGGGGSGTASDGDDTPGPDAKAPANSGFVQITSQSFISNTTTVRTGTASATFAMRTGAASCTEQTLGACTLTTCSGQAQPATNLSAGTITVTGAAIPITLTPKADKTYETVLSMTQPLFMGDETLAASGTGADVPAFSVSVTAPSRPTLTAPAMPASGSMLPINRAQAFHATWMNRSPAGKVYLYFSGPQGSGVSMSCGFDSTALGADVPASTLAMLPAGAGTFSAGVVSSSTTDVGEWRIYANGFFNAVWPDNSYATTMAAFQ
jgi:hypothetical protein